jgi:hypothetical protein
MQSDGTPELPALRAKLKRLMECVLDQAAENPAFAAQLVRVLGGETPPKENSARPEHRQKSMLNPVEFLQKNDMERLRGELHGRDKGELAAILKGTPAGKGRGVAKKDHASLVEEIARYAEGELAKGSVFLRGKGEGSRPAQQEDGSEGVARTDAPEAESGSSHDSSSLSPGR